MLDIIIPQYKENDNKIKPLFDSINNQINIDFNDINVTIVNDGSDTFISDTLLNSYPFKINYIKNKDNKGPGVTRQIGLDNTNDKYIMFMDADDCLASNISLFIILSCVKEAKPKLVITNIVQDFVINNEKKYKIKKGKDTLPWLHGKVYSRDIINKYNVKFHNDLRYFEDSYFTICYMSSLKDEDIITLDFDCYLWKDNDNSITRKDRKYGYVIEEFKDFFYCPFYAYEYLKNSKYPYTTEYMIKAICGIYQYLNSKIFDDKDLKDKKLFYENELDKYISNYKEIFIDLNFDKLQKLYDEEYDALLKREHFDVLNGLDSLAKMLNIK